MLSASTEAVALQSFLREADVAGGHCRFRRDRVSFRVPADAGMAAFLDVFHLTSWCLLLSLCEVSGGIALHRALSPSSRDDLES